MFIILKEAKMKKSRAEVILIAILLGLLVCITAFNELNRDEVTIGEDVFTPIGE